jgi:hypothetical protein
VIYILAHIILKFKLDINHAEAFTLYSELQIAGNDSSLKGLEQHKPIALDPT